MANPSKKSRGGKSRKKPVAKAAPETPVTDLSYGETESDADRPAIPERVMMLPEPLVSDLTEQMPEVMVDAMPDETVQPSTPKVTAAPGGRGVRRWFSNLVARVCGAR